MSASAEIDSFVLRARAFVANRGCCEFHGARRAAFTGSAESQRGFDPKTEAASK